MNIYDASRRMVNNYDGGIESVAPRLGKTWETMAKELRRTNGYKWGAEDALVLTELCVETGVPHATAYAEVVARAAGCRLICLPHMPNVPVTNALETVSSASNAVHALVSEACADLADHKISDNEMERIDRILGDVHAELNRMRRAFFALNQAGKPPVQS